MTWLAVDTVYETETGRELWVNIFWIGDTLFHKFEKPEDWPELPPKTVETFNRPYRAIFNKHMSQAKAWDSWCFRIIQEANNAGFDMELVKAERENPDAKSMHIFAFGIEGGYVKHG